MKLFFYFIKEDVAIIADDHFKVSKWPSDLVYLV